MNILAIETSMGRTSVAVRFADGEGEDRLLVHRLEKGAAQAEKLVPLIGGAMRDAGLNYADLDKIAVCIGPGTFSGVRTGVAAARGVALAASVPVVGATSMALMTSDVLSYRKDVGHFTGANFGLTAPAGSGLYYCQVMTADGAALTDVQVLAPPQALSFFAGLATFIFGPGAPELKHQADTEAFQWPEVQIYPEAATLCHLAPELERGKNEAIPFYVRPPDAKPQMSYTVERLSE